MGWQYVPELFTEAELTNRVNDMWCVPFGGNVDCLWAKIRPKQLTDLVNKRIILYHQDECVADDYDIITESIRMVMYKEQYNQMMKIVNEATPVCP